MAVGVELPSGSRVTHGTGANIREPFAEIPLRMHELHSGTTDPAGLSFRGQLGFISFTTAIRLPRHVHIGADGKLLPERILVMNGAGVVELNGTLTVIPPGSMIEIPAGVPHSWTACPAGVVLPDDTRTGGTFLMIYFYSEPTGFSPTAAVATLRDAADYRRHEEDFEPIRIPALDAVAVRERASLVWNRTLRPLDAGLAPT